ncbi:MAG: hypothetical protein EB084_15890 [Proteobacteria bacterium]|nr:hypothetical protein [Pseudomonadota bacterium]
MISTLRASLSGSVAPTTPCVPDEEPSHGEILHMGLKTYIDAYTHLHGWSEDTVDAAALSYTRVREAANLVERGDLGSQDATSLQDAVKSANRWVAKRLEVLYAYEGGGTMYLHARPRERAEIADVEAQSLACWGQTCDSAPFPLVASFRSRHRDLPEFPNPAVPDLTPQKYKRQLEAEASLLDKACIAAQSLPPGPRAVFSAYLEGTAQLWSDIPPDL